MGKNNSKFSLTYDIAPCINVVKSDKKAMLSSSMTEWLNAIERFILQNVKHFDQKSELFEKLDKIYSMRTKLSDVIAKFQAKLPKKYLECFKDDKFHSKIFISRFRSRYYESLLNITLSSVSLHGAINHSLDELLCDLSKETGVSLKDLNDYYKKER